MHLACFYGTWFSAVRVLIGLARWHFPTSAECGPLEQIAVRVRERVTRADVPLALHAVHAARTEVVGERVHISLLDLIWRAHRCRDDDVVVYQQREVGADRLSIVAISSPL